MIETYKVFFNATQIFFQIAIWIATRTAHSNHAINLALSNHDKLQSWPEKHPPHRNNTPKDYAGLLSDCDKSEFEDDNQPPHPNTTPTHRDKALSREDKKLSRQTKRPLKRDKLQVKRRFAPEAWGRSASRPYPAVFDLGLMPFVAPRHRARLTLLLADSHCPSVDHS
jgi:hypothetical protein